MGMAIDRNSQPIYNEWRGDDWAQYFKDVYKNTDPQTAKNQVWQVWNDQSNPFRHHFPTQEVFIWNLAVRSAGSDLVQPQINQVLTVTADSQPIYNTWSNWWNGLEVWWCPQWQMWYDKNAQKYGATVAQDKFVNAWSYSDNWAWTANTAGEMCGLDCDFVNYFRTKGIDVARFGVQTACNLVSIPTNIIDATANVAQGAKDATGVVAQIAPYAVGAVVIWGVYRLIKQ
jgi:hypothetical protein